MILLHGCSMNDDLSKYYDSGELKSEQITKGDSLMVINYYKNGNVKSRFKNYNEQITSLEYYNSLGMVTFKSVLKEKSITLEQRNLDSDSVGYSITLNNPKFEHTGFNENFSYNLGEDFEDFFFRMHEGYDKTVNVTKKKNDSLSGILFDFHVKMRTDSTGSVIGEHDYL